jgi:hypothetical protein
MKVSGEGKKQKEGDYLPNLLRARTKTVFNQ